MHVHWQLRASTVPIRFNVISQPWYKHRQRPPLPPPRFPSNRLGHDLLCVHQHDATLRATENETPVSRKPKPTTLPPGWPSPYHNKCSQRDCIFPNSPQTVKGAYQCCGVPDGFYCEGTYKVSSSRAQDTERYLKEVSMVRRAAEEAQRRRTVFEMRKPDPIYRRPGRHTPDYVAVEDRRDPGYGPPSRASHGPYLSRDVGRPPQLPYGRPSCSGYGQVEAEYITDQIMMRLYPERKIQPRW